MDTLIDQINRFSDITVNWRKPKTDTIPYKNKVRNLHPELLNKKVFARNSASL